MLTTNRKSETRWKTCKIVKIKRESTHIFGILVQASLDKLFKLLRVIASELRRIVLGDEEEDAHRMQVGIRRLSLGKLDGRYAQRPDIRLQ